MFYKNLSAVNVSKLFPFLTGVMQGIWSFNLKLPNSKIITFILPLAVICLWVIWQPQIFQLQGFFQQSFVSVFYMTPELTKENLPDVIFDWLLVFMAIKIVWGILIGVADVLVFNRLTGKDFDFLSAFNMAIVNMSILFAGLFAYQFIPVKMIENIYVDALSSVPVLFEVNGILAIIVAAVVGDFCFYWAHRFMHNNRFLWNLGHIYHHRNENLTQLTHGVEPRFVLLNAEGVATFVFLPLIASIFTTDFSDAGWMLLGFAVINIWLDPSHSVFLYAVENRYKPLQWLRLIFVTVGVHYTHHSKDPIHNRKTGCNFGSRLTIWDRAFGTYVEPAPYLPEAGLFGKKTDYCLNPIRFIALPYVRFIDEFRKNSIRHWPKILFGSVFWSPPNKSKLSH